MKPRKSSLVTGALPVSGVVASADYPATFDSLNSEVPEPGAASY